MADRGAWSHPIGGDTLTAGVFGDPVAHSLSPVMHNAGYAALGLNRVYLPFRVAAAQLTPALHAVSALGLLGVNVTIPHKERAARFLRDRLSEEARLLGVVNCIINRDGKLSGDNTDARGLQLDLQSHRAPIKDRAVVVIGAGGGAAAALLAAQREGARRIILFNRTRARARRLARRFPALPITLKDLSALSQPSLFTNAGLIVNATPVGLGGEPFPDLPYAATPDDCLFYDLIYRRDTTSFLRPALTLGRRTTDGLGMLLYQGMVAFELFNGVPAPAAAMRQALFDAVGRSVTAADG